MWPDLCLLKHPADFHELCRDLLAAEYPRFQSYEGSGGDEGVDGYDSASETIFQFHMPRERLRKEKVAHYLDAARQHPARNWVLLTTRDLTRSQDRWLDSVRAEFGFSISVLGPSKIYSLMEKHPAIAERYFPRRPPAAAPAIRVASQTAGQIINVAGPTTIKTGRPRIQTAPIPGTVGADPYMKGELERLYKRVGDFRCWEKGRDKARSIFPAIHKKYLSDFGCRVCDTPQERFQEAVEYFHRKIDNTKMGRINKGKGQPSY